jgi:hypothetical protein
VDHDAFVTFFAAPQEEKAVHIFNSLIHEIAAPHSLSQRISMLRNLQGFVR